MTAYAAAGKDGGRHERVRSQLDAAKALLRDDTKLDEFMAKFKFKDRRPAGYILKQVLASAQQGAEPKSIQQLLLEKLEERSSPETGQQAYLSLPLNFFHPVLVANFGLFFGSEGSYERMLENQKPLDASAYMATLNRLGARA